MVTAVTFLMLFMVERPQGFVGGVVGELAAAGYAGKALVDYICESGAMAHCFEWDLADVIKITVDEHGAKKTKSMGQAKLWTNDPYNLKLQFGVQEFDPNANPEHKHAQTPGIHTADGRYVASGDQLNLPWTSLQVPHDSHFKDGLVEIFSGAHMGTKMWHSCLPGRNKVTAKNTHYKLKVAALTPDYVTENRNHVENTHGTDEYSDTAVTARLLYEKLKGITGWGRGGACAGFNRVWQGARSIIPDTGRAIYRAAYDNSGGMADTYNYNTPIPAAGQLVGNGVTVLTDVIYRDPKDHKHGMERLNRPLEIVAEQRRKSFAKFKEQDWGNCMPIRNAYHRHQASEGCTGPIRTLYRNHQNGEGCFPKRRARAPPALSILPKVPEEPAKDAGVDLARAPGLPWESRADVIATLDHESPKSPRSPAVQRLNSFTLSDGRAPVDRSAGVRRSKSAQYL